MPAKHPNILLVFTDQQRADTVGALGNPVIRTPALDRICRGGVAFTSAYSPSPVCVSARCSMIYGQYPHETECYENRPMPEDGRQSFMGTLSEADYRVHGIGKCHFMPDRAALRGFQSRESQEELVACPDDDDYLTHLLSQGFDHITDPHGVRGEMYYIPQVAQMPARLHPTQWVGDRATAFIEEQAATQQPWLLFASFIHPHPPFCPPAPWHKLYRAPMMPLPKVPQDWQSLLTFQNRRQNRAKYRDQGLDQNLLRVQKAYYYACVSFIDSQVGRMLDALERTGQGRDTLVLFTADHGEMLGDCNSFGKRCMLDPSARIPLLARLPGVFDGGRTCAKPTGLVDIAPTVLARCGAELGTHSPSGCDLADVLSGASDREMVFSQHDEGAMATYMAVSENWKYFYSAPDGQEYLFDRVMDPAETRNHVGARPYDEALEAMRGRLISFLREGGETKGLDGDGWKAFPKKEMPANPDAGLGFQDHRWAETSIPGYSG